MNRSDFVRLLGQLASLSPKQRAQLQGALTELHDAGTSAVAHLIPAPRSARTARRQPDNFALGAAAMGWPACAAALAAEPAMHSPAPHWPTCAIVSNGCAMRRP